MNIEDKINHKNGLIFGELMSQAERVEYRKYVTEHLVDMPEGAEEINVKSFSSDWLAVEFKLAGEYHRCYLEHLDGKYWPRYGQLHYDREQGGPFPRLEESPGNRREDFHAELLALAKWAEETGNNYGQTEYESGEESAYENVAEHISKIAQKYKPEDSDE